MDILARLMLTIAILFLSIVVLGLVGIIGVQLSWIAEVWIDRIFGREVRGNRRE